MSSSSLESALSADAAAAGPVDNLILLSMLSTIHHPAKLHSGGGVTNTGTEQSPTSSPSTSAGSNRYSAASVADMSRRKQRNPKPFFNPSEEVKIKEGDQEEDIAEEDEVRDASSDHPSDDDNSREGEDDNSGPEDLSSFVKVEVLESSSSPASPPSDTPTSSVPLPALPQLTPMPKAISSSSNNNNKHSVEEILSKSNMFHFGDVAIADHPDTFPVPMVIPMVYLFPIMPKEPGCAKVDFRYRMFVPLNAPLTLDPLNINIPPSTSIMAPKSSPTPPPPPPPPPPALLKRKRKASGDSNKKDTVASTTTIPLDLSKSPAAAATTTDHESSDSSSTTSSSSCKSPPQMLLNKEQQLAAKQQREIEAHLAFLKAKHLEFLKQQQQQLLQPPLVVESRCEECNINFSKHQNYVAHKKYYCSGGAGGGAPKPKGSSGSDKKTSSMTSPGATDRKVLASPPKQQQQQELGKELQQLLLAKAALPPIEIPQQSPPPPPQTMSSPSPLQLPHFVCEGCGIKFKSVSNLQAHQARYCAGLRKAEEIRAFENALLKQQQQQQQQQPNFSMISAAEMMSFLNAKSLEQQAKAISSNVEVAAAADNKADFCCILCGYKEQSVERLKDHINMHFIGQVKKEQNGGNNNAPSSSAASSPSVSPAAAPMDDSKKKEEENSPPEKKRPKLEVVEEEPKAVTAAAESPKEALKCDSCDIGFAHLSNYMAHKKYYCRGLAAAAPKAAATASNGEEK